LHRTDHSRFRKSHDFVPDFSKSERRTRIVIAITGVMMVVEIAAGLLSHSMALLADGWHMSTHVTAFLITAIAYSFTRRLAANEQFSFGTGKIGVLGGFASAVVSSWAHNLLRDSSGTLLDRTPGTSDLPGEIRRAVEADGDSIVTDLHVWQVGTGKFAAMVSVCAHEPRSSDFYRELLREHDELVHITIETQHCREDHPATAGLATS